MTFFSFCLGTALSSAFFRFNFMFFCVDSLRPHELYGPWNSLGQNTGVGSCSLLQGIFPTQGLNSGLMHCRQILYQLSHKGSPRILEWVAYPFSSRSSRPRNQTGSLALQADSLPAELWGKLEIYRKGPRPLCQEGFPTILYPIECCFQTIMVINGEHSEVQKNAKRRISSFGPHEAQLW